MFFIKILSNCWFSKISITTGENHSFGPVSISDFYTALKNVKKGIVKSDIEKWIFEIGYFRFFPPELIVPHNLESFVRILNEYEKDVSAFLDKNDKFYLWIQKQHE